MPLASAAAGLRGALLLARGRAEGAALVEPGAQGALHSFWALAACLPILLLMGLARPASDPLDADLAQVPLLTSLAAYGISWLAFAVLSHRIAGTLGAGANWFGFITVWSWCSVVQQAMVAVGSLPALLDVPGPVPAVAVLVDALTTLVGFGSLMIASHQGLQSLGRVLTLGVTCCLFTSLVLLPAFLTWVTRNRGQAKPVEAARPATLSDEEAAALAVQPRRAAAVEPRRAAA